MSVDGVRAGQQISTGEFPEAVQARDLTFNTNITNTSYAAGTPENGVTFVAPTSGRVGIYVSGGLRQNDATNRIFMSFELHEGTDNTGTSIVSPTVERGISTDGTAGEATILGNMSMVEGLTPGTTYYVRSMFLTTGGTTNDVFGRTVGAIPLP